MIDNITIFNNDFRGDLNLNKLQRAFPAKAEQGFDYFKIAPRKYKDEKVWLLLKTRMYEGKRFVLISGSIRKWYFGLNSFSDLDFYSFEKTIDLLGRIICNDSLILWGFRVRSIEFGFTLNLPMTYKDLPDSYADFQNFKRIWYQGETSSFVGKDSFTMSVYDKGEEVLKCRKLRDSKKDPKPISKLISKRTFIRYEMKVKRVEKVPCISEKAKTLGHVWEQWEDIRIELVEKIKAMRFIRETLAGQTYDFEGGNFTDLKNYLIFLGSIHAGGSRKTLALTEKLKRNKKEAKTSLSKILKEYSDVSGEMLELELKRKINKRSRKLSQFRYFL